MMRGARAEAEGVRGDARNVLYAGCYSVAEEPVMALYLMGPWLGFMGFCRQVNWRR